MRAKTVEITAEGRELARAEARLPRWMLAAGGAGTLATLALGGARTAAGLALGASLAILNYFWLHEAIRVLFSMESPRVPKLVVAKFLVRYPLAVAGVYFFYRTGWLPITAILAGLFVPVAGVLIEAVVQISEGFRDGADDQQRTTNN